MYCAVGKVPGKPKAIQSTTSCPPSCTHSCTRWAASLEPPPLPKCDMPVIRCPRLTDTSPIRRVLPGGLRRHNGHRHANKAEVASERSSVRGKVERPLGPRLARGRPPWTTVCRSVEGVSPLQAVARGHGGNVVRRNGAVEKGPSQLHVAALESKLDGGQDLVLRGPVLPTQIFCSPKFTPRHSPGPGRSQSIPGSEAYCTVTGCGMMLVAGWRGN